MTYVSELQQIIDSLDISLVDFGLELTYDENNEKVPTQAFGEFLTNREQGDWAEQSLISAINDKYESLVAVPYGKNENLIAGDPGFKEFYKKYKKELCEIGKRPDVLIFEAEQYEPYRNMDLTQLSFDEQQDIVPKALAGLEVRSSAYLQKRFTPKEDRPSLTFTPKKEDLLVVKKWIDNFKIPHFYVQVFFDSAYIISFKKILELMATSSTKGRSKKKFYINDELSFVLDKAPKNQFKDTINIFLKNGLKISDNVSSPTLNAHTKELAHGRLLNYISFEKSNIEIIDDFESYIRGY